ncbi:hypothetical protein E4T42_01110 [Aureobasidium subglaciale]|nr:hypothetical protein E4T42_01110 [Aureobasidium subglaciale]
MGYKKKSPVFSPGSGSSPPGSNGHPTPPSDSEAVVIINDKAYTYRQRLRMDAVAQANALRALKASDEWIYEMSGDERNKLRDAEIRRVNTQRINDDTHASTLFEEHYEEPPTRSPEEYADDWLAIKKATDQRKSGLKGKPGVMPKMVPKKKFPSEEKVSAEDLADDVV